MTDLIGITSTIDHIIYMTLNIIATLLWRLDAALISMSLYSYGTQDWLTGSGSGGVWGVLEWLIGSGGLAGLTTWTLFGGLALMLWGLAKIAKPFISFQPVDIGKLVIFFVLSYVVISQGTSLMPAIEEWREGAGSVVYEAISSSDAAVIDVPAAPATSDPLGSPADLDGTGVIRGWEAVATTYFLVTTPEELHRSYPPDEFLHAYCLYNPELPITSQAVTNAAGCSPRLAWDEWDGISIDVLQDSYGIDLDPILTPVQEFFGWFGINFDFSSLITTVPVVRHHPENRELGNRQVQAGIARLAMGLIVAVFPMVEANISLMLALAASFIYITLPIALLFGFFLSTESIVNRLFMQFAAVVLRTIIVQGMVALFMLMLMNTAATGSLTAYLGLVGVGLIGGWVLIGVATSTMKETFSQSVGAVSSIWMGSATGLLGQGAAAPAAAALGAAKLAGGTALLAAGAWTGGVGRTWDLYGTTAESNSAGMGDLRAGAPGVAAYIDKQRGRLPDSLYRLTSQLGLAADAEASLHGAAAFSDPSTLPSASQVGLAAGIGRPDPHQTSTYSHQQNESWQPGRQPLYSTTTTSHTPEARQRRNAAVDRWIDQSYKARETQIGQRRASEAGRDLLGEELTWKVERAMERHTPAEVSAVVAAARAAAEEGNRADLLQNGRLTRKAVEEVKQQLDPETAQAFQGEKGAWDLAALTAAGLQGQKQADPEEFRQAMARSKSGWGQESPAHNVPKELGLDPVAAGSAYTAMNRFARLADDANLSEKQREQLLKEAQSGKVSDTTRAELEKAIAEQQKQGRAQGLTVDGLIAGASAVPTTIAGPEQVWTTPAKPAQLQGGPDTADQALLGIELKRKQKGKKDQVEGGTASVPVGGDTVAVAAASAAHTATAAAATASPVSGLTGPAQPQTGGRRGNRAGLGEAPAMIGSTRPETGGGQDGGRTGQVVEPMVAAPTMASRSSAMGTGDPPSPPDAGRGTRNFGQELRGHTRTEEGAISATQQPGLIGGAPPTEVAPNLGAPAGVGGQIFYASGEPSPSSGFSQELRAEVHNPASPTGWIGSVATEPFVDTVTNLEAPANTGDPMFYPSGGFDQPGSFGQEFRPTFPDPDPLSPPVNNPPSAVVSPSADSTFAAARTPISNIAPDFAGQQPSPTAAPAADFSANMGIPSGVGGSTPSFYSGSGLGQSSGFGQELRAAVEDPAPMPPPVSSPPPAGNSLVSSLPEPVRPPIGETFRQPEPLNAPPLTSAPAASAPPMMQHTSQPVTSTSSATPNPTRGSSGGLGQELHQAASAPAPPPVMSPTTGQLAAAPTTPAPVRGQSITPPPARPQRGTDGSAAPIKPPPARTRGANTSAQTQSAPAKPETDASRGSERQKEKKDKKGSTTSGF